jgi:hypothetical protein
MPVSSVTGKDSLIINGTVITGLADANAVDVTPIADIVNIKRGKDGNTMYAKNEEGNRASMTIRLALGCQDDKNLDALLASWQASASDFVLMTGSFYKRTGDGQGGIQTLVYQLTGGVPKAFPQVLTSAEGNIDQSVRMWTILWGGCTVSTQ